MKYDLSRCNNLRWEYNGRKGVIKTYGERFTLLTDDEELNGDGEIVRSTFICSNTESLMGCLTKPEDFRIIPRDPETYTDWQVGDVVEIDEYEEINLQVVVAARINNVVICNYIKDNMVFGMFTCEELKKKGSLVLTDYEKELAGESKCKFKKGDVVLVRDHESDKWIAGFFDEINEGAYYKYCIYSTEPQWFKQCIPYNEKTWRLLGTTDEYKGESNE